MGKTLVLVALILLSSLAPSSGHFMHSHRLMIRTNTIRIYHAIRPLARSRTLARYARQHSRRMALKGRLFHSNLTRIGLHLNKWRVLGENVGVVAVGANILHSFMESSEHRANILNARYKKIGIGIYKYHGLLWVSQLFKG